ncbi:MAG: Hint domain-containing protein [Rhodobacteraceae bacterium]|nr:Hint domain-containing protein [Paracoccaceae bacterium]
MSYYRSLKSELDHACSFPGGVAEGANVRTPCGGRRVEMLRPGDLVVTRDAGLQPVRMVWKRTLESRALVADPSLAPVRFATRALGPMMPQRPVMLAPAQHVLVPAYRIRDRSDSRPCLMAARDIAHSDDGSMFKRSDQPVTFVQIIFDAHHIFCVEGLPVESFRPTRHTLDALDKALQDEVSEVYPGLRKNQEIYPTLDYTVLTDAPLVPAQG